MELLTTVAHTAPMELQTVPTARTMPLLDPLIMAAQQIRRTFQAMRLLITEAAMDLTAMEHTITILHRAVTVPLRETGLDTNLRQNPVPGNQLPLMQTMAIRRA